MIKNPTEEIVFMNVMTLLCEYTGLRADKHYSIEHKEEDIPPMTLNENYTYISTLLEKVFKKEASIMSLIEEIKNILCIELHMPDNDTVEWEKISGLDTLMQYINGYIKYSYELVV